MNNSINDFIAFRRLRGALEPWQRELAVLQGSNNQQQWGCIKRLSGPYQSHRRRLPINAQADGDDIRFTSGETEISYWIERWDYVNGTALVWMNVTQLQTGANTIRMWYGNPSAGSVSNGDATFLFF